MTSSEKSDYDQGFFDGYLSREDEVKLKEKMLNSIKKRYFDFGYAQAKKEKQEVTLNNREFRSSPNYDDKAPNYRFSLDSLIDYLIEYSREFIPLASIDDELEEQDIEEFIVNSFLNEDVKQHDKSN